MSASAEKITETKYMKLPLMKPGEVLYTLPWEMRMEFPLGHIAVSSVHAWIVSATNASFVGDQYDTEAQMREVPLSEVYNHHWVAMDLKLPDSRNREIYADFVRAQDKSFPNSPCEALKVSICISVYLCMRVYM